MKVPSELRWVPIVEIVKAAGLTEEAEAVLSQAAEAIGDYAATDKIVRQLGLVHEEAIRRVTASAHRSIPA